MANRHQRRKANAKVREANERQAIVNANLAVPQAPTPTSRLVRETMQQIGWKPASIYSGGLHRNNAVPRKPQSAQTIELRLAPTHRKSSGKMHWNLDSYVDNLALRSVKQTSENKGE